MSEDVFVIDMDGNVVIVDTLITGANGFIDLWLPRDKQFRISVHYEGKKVESIISTIANDGTCITRLQLM